MPLLILLTLIAAMIMACSGLLLANTERQSTICLVITILLVIAVPVEFWIDIKYFRPERIKQEKQEIYNKYKNGPLEIKRNTIGCIKYKYYDDEFWTCPNKNITQIEEKIGKHTVQTPVIQTK